MVLKLILHHVLVQNWINFRSTETDSYLKKGKILIRFFIIVVLIFDFLSIHNAKCAVIAKSGDNANIIFHR